MQIKAKITDDNNEYGVIYNDAESFESLQYSKVTQAYGVCFYGDKMVIVKNGKKGTWGLVGGSLEKGESFEECLRREIIEESNMRTLYNMPIGYQEIKLSDTKSIYQLRYYCEVQPISPFVADPDGTISEIKLIDPEDYKKYFDWGEIGERIIQRAIAIRAEASSDITIKTYQESFEKYKARAVVEVSGEFKEWFDMFASFLPTHGSILELGSATGRDARYFASRGFKITCTDVIPEALERLADDGFETSYFDFRDEPKQEWKNKFDGIFANAVLLHAPQDILDRFLSRLPQILKKGGVISFSLKNGEGEEITQDKMDAPRYFNYHSEAEIRKLLDKLSLEILSISYAENNKWLQVIAKIK